MLGDDRFEGSFFAEGGRVFGTDGVEMSLGIALGGTLRLDCFAQVRDLRIQATGAL